MKLLKPGTEQEGWAQDVPCTGNGNGLGGCGALLRVEAQDLFKTQFYCCDTYVTFRCNQCGAFTDLGEAWNCGVPSHIVSRLPVRQPSSFPPFVGAPQSPIEVPDHLIRLRIRLSQVLRAVRLNEPATILAGAHPVAPSPDRWTTFLDGMSKTHRVYAQTPGLPESLCVLNLTLAGACERLSAMYRREGHPTRNSTFAYYGDLARVIQRYSEGQPLYEGVNLDWLEHPAEEHARRSVAP